MKEFRIVLIMTFIPIAFVLLLEGSHTSQLGDKIAFIVGGIALFIASIVFWQCTAKQIKKREQQEENERLQEKESRDNLITAINDLVSEFRKDRAEKNKQGSK